MARLMILDSVYDGYLNWLYRTHPGLEDAPYQTQHEATVDGGFHNATVLTKPLENMGHEIIDVWINHTPLQIRWCVENDCETILKANAESYKIGGLTISQQQTRPWYESVVEEQVKHFRPDILWIADIHMLASPFLNKIQGAYGYAVGEIATTPPTTGLNRFDLIVSGAMPIVEQLRLRGLSSELLLHGFNQNVLEFMSPSKKQYNLAFVGQMHDGRMDMIHTISKEIDVDVWTNSDLLEKNNPESGIQIHAPVYGIPMYQVLRDSKIILNKHIYAVDNFATNQRLYEVTGVGTMLLTDAKENLGDLFQVDKEVVAYSSDDECIELAKYYLEYDNAREQIAKAGCRRTLRDHTINNRAKDIICILQQYAPSFF